MGDSRNSVAAGDHVSVAPTDEQIARRIEELVRRRPLLAMAAASTLGMVLGGALFTRLGRLGAIAAAGYIANGLWRRDRRLDIAEIVEGLSR